MKRNDIVIVLLLIATAGLWLMKPVWLAWHGKFAREGGNFLDAFDIPVVVEGVIILVVALAVGLGVAAY